MYTYKDSFLRLFASKRSYILLRADFEMNADEDLMNVYLMSFVAETDRELADIFIGGFRTNELSLIEGTQDLCGSDLSSIDL